MLTEETKKLVRDAAVAAAKRQQAVKAATTDINPNGAFYNWRNLAPDRDRFFTIYANDFGALYATFVDTYLAVFGYVKATP